MFSQISSNVHHLFDPASLEADCSEHKMFDGIAGISEGILCRFDSVTPQGWHALGHGCSTFKTDEFKISGNIIALFILLSIPLYHLFRSKKQDLSPPRVPMTEREALMNLGGPDSPWFLLEMVEKIGSDIYQLSSENYIVGDAQTAREILSDETTTKAMIYQIYTKLFGADNVLTRSENDERWQNVRKAVHRSMSSSEVARMKVIVIDQTDHWVKNTLEPLVASGKSFDPFSEMSRITFKIIVEAAMEYKISDEEYESYCYHLLKAKKELAKVAYGNRFRKFYAPFFSDHRDGMHSCKEVIAFGKKLLDAYRQNPNKSSNNTLIKLLDSPGVCVDEEHRIGEINNFIFGGHDSTAHTIAHTLVLLAQHADVQKQLREDLSELDEHDRPKCQYMRNIIAEGNRLFPSPAIGSVRQTGRDISCKNGTMVIPKGATVYLVQYLSHRNSTAFKNPAEFLPNRWDNPTKAMKESIFMFAYGPRNCAGQSLALTELHNIISKLMTSFEMSIEKEGTLMFYTHLKREGTLLKATRK